jgi:hypothetical protein
MKTKTTKTVTTTATLQHALHVARLEMADALRDLGMYTARLAVVQQRGWPSRAYASDATFAAAEARRIALQVALLESALSQRVDAFDVAA